MNKHKIADFFMKLRNFTCFLFTWLSLLVLAGAALLHEETLPVCLFAKLFVFSLLTAALLVVAFLETVLHKKSFLFRLTVFFVGFVPMEILCFYWMGLFSGNGSFLHWGFFVLLIAVFYIASVIIDRTVYAKKGVDYTKRLEEYKMSINNRSYTK